MHHSIYDYPDIYDAVLRAPLDQIELEASSVEQLLARRGIPRGRILELACGTCSHGIRLAQRGHDVVGLDLSEPMLAAAARHAQAAGVVLPLYRRDLIEFDLPQEEPFDCVIFMAETFPLLTAYAELVKHFASVRGVLRGGRDLCGGCGCPPSRRAHRIRGVGTTHHAAGRRLG